MNRSQLFKWLILCQSVYTLLTALWPIFHVKSFMEVTGYKTDVWLVKTVGALLVPIALTMLSFLFYSKFLRPAIILGASTAVAFMAIDFYYATIDMIPDIYLADGVIEAMFLCGWIYLFIRSRDVKPS